MEAIIKSEIFAGYPEIIHGVSTKTGGQPPFFNNLSRHVGDDITAVMANRAVFFGALGIDETGLVHANQIHSDNIVSVITPGLVRECDGFITEKAGLFLVISVADCLPVMIYDRRTGALGNVHSGWRGTAAGIVVNALNKMSAQFGSRPEDLLVFAGPGIGKDKFEVGMDAAEMFDKKYVRPRSGKFFIDLKSAVRDQLLSAGVLKENIDISQYCTYSEKDYLHSYRREGEKSGRMFAVIGRK